MTRYVQVEQVTISRAQPISVAAQSVTSADVLCGFDTYAWPEQETAWWSPPLPSFSAAINGFTAYDATKDMVRARQARWVDEYQEQHQPFRAFPAAAQAFPVYSYSTDMVRAKQARWVDEYQPQYESFPTFQAGINGQTGPVVTPIFQVGPRYIAILPPRPFTISAISMQTFDVKDPSEQVLVTFNLGPDLAPGETLIGVPTAVVTVVQGTDPAPNNIVTGRLGFDTTLTQVVVPVAGGISGVFYEIEVTAQSSNFQKKLSLAGVLPVRSII